jgi:hypothetical protein
MYKLLVGLEIKISGTCHMMQSTVICLAKWLR